MGTLYQILGLVGASLVIWLIYKSVRTKPDIFNRNNLSKSLTTMGVLALALICFIAFLIVLISKHKY